MLHRKVRPPSKWYGAKWYLKDKIIALFPPRTTYHTYVEPYCGMANVFFAHDPEGKAEILNDINPDLMNFFLVLQNEKKFARFARLASCSPFSEALFQSAAEFLAKSGGTDIERALHFFILARQSRSGDTKNFAPITKNRLRRGMNEQVSAWLSSVRGLPEVHARLQRVLLLNRPAVAVIQEFDQPDCVIYCDCPYYPDSRAAPTAYGENDMTAEDHEELIEVIKKSRSKILLSGYDNPLYAEELKDWRREDFLSPNHISGDKQKRVMVESVWMSY